MTTPKDVLDPIKTRGDFRRLNERAQQGIDSANANEISSDNPIWDIWDAIRQAFPGPTANWSDEPEPAWAYAVRDLTTDQVRCAIERMMNSGREFPPTAPQFRQWALDPDPEAWRRASHRPVAGRKRIGSTRLSLEERKARLAALRKETGL